MKTFLLAMMLLTSCLGLAQELPDAPQPQTKITDYEVHNAPSKFKTEEPGFFAFRQSWQDPPLRTNKQFFKSKTFWLSQAAGMTALIIACRKPETSHEHWDSELPAFAGVFGMSYLGGRYFTQSFAVAPGLYEAVHYSLTASK